MATQKEIKNSLTNQLDQQGKVGIYFEDLVKDYAELWKLKNTLQKDIAQNGIRLKTVGGNGFEIVKPNESVTNLLKVNTSMLKLLSELGLQAPMNESDSDEDGAGYL